MALPITIFKNILDFKCMHSISFILIFQRTTSTAVPLVLLSPLIRVKKFSNYGEFAKIRVQITNLIPNPYIFKI